MGHSTREYCSIKRVHGEEVTRTGGSQVAGPKTDSWRNVSGQPCQGRVSWQPQEPRILESAECSEQPIPILSNHHSDIVDWTWIHLLNVCISVGFVAVVVRELFWW
jgi:hypothetical protein